MINLLSRYFIKDSTDYSNALVRSSYGILCGIVGVILNILLFSAKLFAGIISGSVAVIADAFNNLSDAGSSVITLIGFRLSAAKPDKDHPFGHGRIEYISGLIVSMIIFLMGFELLKTTFDKILHPQDIRLEKAAFIILIISVFVKLYIAFYNRSIGKKIDSPAMLATSFDGLSDAVSTVAVIVSMIITHFTGFKIDGICGFAVALFILYAGFNAAKETINPLLGQPPSKDFVDQIHSIVMSYPQILGIHDLIVHDYGPGRIMISLHAEVDENANLLETHDVIDNIEKFLCDRLECNAVIHMDPIALDDDETNYLKENMCNFLENSIGNDLSIHDFRIVKGNTHTNIIFDIMVPYDFPLKDEEIKNKVYEYLDGFEKRYFAVITIDRSYI